MALTDISVLETIACPLCGGDRHEVYYPANYPADCTVEELIAVYRASSDHKLMGQVVVCSDCSLAYLNPRPSPDLIVSGYSQAQDATFVEQNQQRIKTFSRNLSRLVRDLGIQPSRAVNVLDVGCAGGAFPKAASDLGFSVVGVEPSEWMCAQGRRLYNLDLRPGVLADHAFEPEQFQIVTLWDVVEHLPDPSEVLGQIHELLDSSGHLIINYPDYQSSVGKLLGKRWPFWLDVHLTYFTQKTIADLLARNGFEVVRFSRYWQTLELGYVLKRAGGYFRVFGWLGKGVSAIGLGAIPCRYYMGQWTVVARKA